MSAMPDGPFIEISPKTVACPGHGEHLREQWPKGFVGFSMTIVQAALESPTFADAVRKQSGAGPGERLDVEAINVITVRRPLCYFVDSKVILKALLAAEIARIGRCDVCGVPGMGGPYQTRYATGDRTIEHMCFGCAIKTGDRLHAAHPNGGVWGA